ncbi:MAG: hypothetical protein ACYDA8_16705 [Deferrisomatales bacterium]
MRQFLATAASLPTCPFLLNFVRESHHAEYLYRYHDIAASRCAR